FILTSGSTVPVTNFPVKGICSTLPCQAFLQHILFLYVITCQVFSMEETQTN
ncbi:hypothetical protein P7K49_038520, partial [Saguinus oedipus]